MLRIVLYNGLCNRLLPLASCLRIANKTQRKVQFIWKFTPNRTCMFRENNDVCSFNELYENKIEEIPENTTFSGVLYNFFYWENCIKEVDTNTNLDININYCLSTIRIKNIDKSLPFDLILQSRGFVILDSFHREIGDYLNLFQPVKELQDEILKTQALFRKNMIGVHIRSSDGDFANINWREIAPELCLMLKNQPENTGVFLCTDSQEIENYFKDIPGLVKYDPPKIILGVESDTKYKNNKFNTFTAVIDLKLLSFCKKAIIGTTGSTFSLSGILMSGCNKSFLVKFKLDLKLIKI